MAHYETTVEVTVKVLFTGTEPQFNALTRAALNERAAETVKALLPGVVVNDPTFKVEPGPSFDQRFYSDEELAQASPSRPWAKRPTAVIKADLPVVEESVAVEATCAVCGDQCMVPHDEDPEDTLCVACAEEEQNS